MQVSTQDKTISDSNEADFRLKGGTGKKPQAMKSISDEIERGIEEIKGDRKIDVNT